MISPELKAQRVKQGVKIAAVFAALLLPCAANATSPTEKFQPGSPYYFENFDPSRKPWEPGQDLNIEEVFKNYVYYEIVFDKSGREMTVNRYIQNRKEQSKKYRVGPDGALEEK